MICIARTFGAPDTVPAGKHDTSASSRSRSSASTPSTIEVRCMTCENFSRPMNCGTRTDPYWHCLLYTSDAADDLLCVDPGGRRIIKKKTGLKVALASWPNDAEASRWARGLKWG